MSRSNKTWGNSRNALNNRLQQSRIARNIEPAPAVDIEVNTFPITDAGPRGETRPLVPGANIEFRVLDDMWIGATPPSTTERTRFDYIGKAAQVAKASHSKKERVTGERVFVHYKFETPLNPVNLKSAAAILANCVRSFFQSGDWGGPTPMQLVSMTPTEQILYKDQLHKWCSYLIRKYFLPKRELHYPITIKIDSAKNILSWYRGDTNISAHSSISRSGLLGFKDISQMQHQVDSWAKNVEVFLTSEQRPTWLSLGDMFYEQGTSFVAYPRQGVLYGAVKFDPRTGNKLCILYPRVAFSVKNSDPFLVPVADNIALDIMRCAVGFWLNKELTRPWSDFDIASYSKESYEQYTRLRMEHHVKSANKLIGSNFYPLGEYLGKEYALVPLLDSASMGLEGQMMSHCVTQRTYLGSNHRFYSIREAEYVDGKLVLGRPRITFDVNLSVSFPKEEASVPFSKNSVLEVPKVITKWTVSSIKGIRNMNNPKWGPLLERAGKLLGIPTLASSYCPTERHCDGEA